MSTAILPGIGFEGSSKEKRKGFFARILDAMIEARAHQAKLYVNHHLLTLSDEELKAAGFDRAQLEREGASPHAL